MRLSQALLSLATVSSGVAAGATRDPYAAHEPASRRFDTGEDIDIGMVNDMESFFDLIGAKMEDITPQAERRAEIDEADAIVNETGMSYPQEFTTLQSQNQLMNICDELPSYLRIPCERMPFRVQWWHIGVPYLIRYGPGHMTAWLNDVSNMIKAGRDLRATIVNNNGAESSGVEPARAAALGWTGVEHVHFKVPYVAEDGHTLADLSEDGIKLSGEMYNEYSFDMASGEVHYEDTIANVTVDQTEYFRRRSVEKREIELNDIHARQIHERYTMLLTIKRRSNILPIAPTGCMANLLRQYISRTSENHQYTCQAFDDLSSGFRSALGIFIYPEPHVAFEPQICC